MAASGYRHIQPNCSSLSNCPSARTIPWACIQTIRRTAHLLIPIDRGPICVQDRWISFRLGGRSYSGSRIAFPEKITSPFPWLLRTGTMTCHKVRGHMQCRLTRLMGWQCNFHVSVRQLVPPLSCLFAGLTWKRRVQFESLPVRFQWDYIVLMGSHPMPSTLLKCAADKIPDGLTKL